MCHHPGSVDWLILKLQLTEESVAAWWQSVCQLSAGLGGPETIQSCLISLSRKSPTRRLVCSALPVLQNKRFS